VSNPDLVDTRQFSIIPIHRSAVLGSWWPLSSLFLVMVAGLKVTDWRCRVEAQVSGGMAHAWPELAVFDLIHESQPLKRYTVLVGRSV
jgi:hypothetical protein